MKPILSSVPSTFPDPPYPADTRANGWRFELDFERIKRSDTWVLADPEWRPWLLMIWVTAWDQIPSGSLPADHSLIAARIGIDIRTFAAHADILLRGFVRHSDGRLYHPVVVEHVTRMLDWKAKEKQRKADYRRRLMEDGMSHGTDAGQTPDWRGTDGTGTGTGTGTERREERKDMLTHVRAKPDSVSVRKPSPPCPYAQILDLWREILPELPQPYGVENWTDARKSQIRARWNNELPSLDLWRTMMEDIRKSKFLMGKVPPSTGHRQFRCDLFWITKPENLLRLMENKYHG